jgi:hypothetical protein
VSKKVSGQGVDADSLKNIYKINKYKEKEGDE